MLPSKKANIPAAIALGQVMTKRIIPQIIVPYLLSPEDDNDDKDSQAAEKQQAKEEAIKTLLMVHNVADADKSKTIYQLL